MGARLAIVGVGWWATFNHIPTIEAIEHADIVAICDLDSEKLKIVGAEFGISAQYTDITEMLSKEKLDGVLISTPHIYHTEAAILALEAGCHVLVEKPMATTAKDGTAIYEASKFANKQVLIPTAMNFEDHTKQAVDWVAANDIGDIRHVVCQMGSALADLFNGEPMLETEDHLFRPPASTWADPQKCGGYGWGQMSHSLAWLFYVTDLTLESVYCMDGKSSTGVDLYDAAVARASNGATVVLSGSSTVPKHRGLHLEVRLYGTKGMIVFDTERARLEMHLHDGNYEIVTLSQDDVAYDGALPVQAFAALCKGEAVVNASNAECGAKTVETLDALYLSAKKGELVNIGAAR
ncbi:MAG: Gfo/Idh/MocA family oxidoreductase [OCS116 cluster bacterium]|uniref:Oxidoreductase n=1 Tax=OCS116 cluster bacterium TaxID=2030921 RepID=A0A2A4Z7S0_9PROT|nr:Gfo/Idh/MocA family oxidoreductase [OCS116 cluster bacterium]